MNIVVIMIDKNVNESTAFIQVYNYVVQYF